ncbi:hypothetical protein ACOMHN_047280 [Nucella lapillus]
MRCYLAKLTDTPAESCSSENNSNTRRLICQVANQHTFTAAVYSSTPQEQFPSGLAGCLTLGEIADSRSGLDSMRRVLWLALLSTCLMGLAVESVVIRSWRAKAKLRHLPGEAANDNDPSASGGRQVAPKSKRKGFRPTHSRCCKIGEKVAKRKLSCNVQVLEVVRQYNDMQRAKLKYNRPRKFVNSKISAKLSNKLRKCSAVFPKYFEKCCKYREQFFNSMSKCAQQSGKERRKCKQSVRKRYKSPNAGRGKSQRKARKKTSAKH